MFLINRFGHFFVIEQSAENRMEPSALKGCRSFQSLELMYQWVKITQELSEDEVKGHEIYIRYSKAGYQECDGRGMWREIHLKVGKRIEEYLSEYEV